MQFVVTEIIMIGASFYFADEIECNLLWCEFRTTRTNINDSIIIKTHRKCYLNGKVVSCNNQTLPIVPTDGNFDKWDW